MRRRTRNVTAIRNGPDELAAAAVDAGQPERVEWPHCPRCNLGWHGLPRKDNGCPGSLAEAVKVVDLRKVRPESDDAALERVFGPRYRQAS